MLSETFASTFGVKAQWTRVQRSDLSKDPDLAKELLRLIGIAYKPLGGHLKIKSPKDLTGAITFITAVDVDKDPQADATLLGRKVGNAVKLTALGQDGSALAKKEALSYWGELLRRGKAYAEVSGPIAHIMLTRHSVPTVGGQKVVERVLGKKVEWVGERPDGKYPGVKNWYRRKIGGGTHMKILVGRVGGAKSGRTEAVMEYVTEFNHLAGIGPSLCEKVAADPMLSTLAKAFSVKAVRPVDVKFIRYRKVGHGVELEDVASRLGDILTSVESKEADPKALVAFLKKHGAKPAPKVTEEVGKSWVNTVVPKVIEAGGKVYVVRSVSKIEAGMGMSRTIDSRTGKQYYTHWLRLQPVRGKKKLPEYTAKTRTIDAYLGSDGTIGIKQGRSHRAGVLGMTFKAVHGFDESLDEAEKSSPLIGWLNEKLKSKGIHAWHAKDMSNGMYHVAFGKLGSKYAEEKWVVDPKRGGVHQIETSADKAYAAVFSLIKKARSEIKRSPDLLKVESLDEAGKTSIHVTTIKSKHGDSYKFDVTGEFRGDPIHVESLAVHMHIDRIGSTLVGHILPDTKFHRESGKSFPYGFRMKIEKAVLAELLKLAKKHGSDIEESTASLDEGSQVGKTILHQMGGSGAIVAMLGGSYTYLSKGVGIRWPNKQRSKGNYVEIVLTPADEYDVTFYNMKGTMKYWHPENSKKAVKRYKGLMFDQLREIFYKQTGWTLSKPRVRMAPASPEREERIKKAKAELRASWKKAGLL